MTPTPPHKFHIHIPDKLWKEFEKIAARNRRKLKEEALIAIERHIETESHKGER